MKAIEARFEKAPKDSGALRPEAGSTAEVNAKGELVITAILPPTWPNEWAMAERRR